MIFKLKLYPFSARKLYNTKTHTSYVPNFVKKEIHVFVLLNQFSGNLVVVMSYQRRNVANVFSSWLMRKKNTMYPTVIFLNRKAGTIMSA